jgi:hypothetical protein
MTQLTIKDCYHDRESENTMTEIGFAVKEVIPQEVCRLEVLSAEKAEAYGLQIGLKLKVVGGEHDGHAFMDYANRDEDTGEIKQGSKAWTIFEACLGRDFHKRSGVSLESLVGKAVRGTGHPDQDWASEQGRVREHRARAAGRAREGPEAGRRRR